MSAPTLQGPSPAMWSWAGTSPRERDLALKDKVQEDGLCTKGRIFHLFGFEMGVISTWCTQQCDDGAGAFSLTPPCTSRGSAQFGIAWYRQVHHGYYLDQGVERGFSRRAQRLLLRVRRHDFGEVRSTSETIELGYSQGNNPHR